MTSPSFDAILWDYDGTLVDSEPIWHQEELVIAQRHGAELPPRFWEQTIGGSVLNTGRFIAERIPGGADGEAIATEIMDAMVARLTREAPPTQPGAGELIDAAAAAGIPQALVSASWSRILQPFLATRPGRFGAVVAGDDVTRSKPDPEPYRTAAATLGVDPTRCLAIEDSPTGIASALAAGAVVLAVHTVLPPDPAPRLVVRDSLRGLDLAALSELFEQRRVDA